MLINLNSTTGIPAQYANRHGLITGQTGTGKSVSLMTLAEQFALAGVPVFVSDVKGDLSALARGLNTRRVDLFGNAGEQIRVTFDAMGADLVARALELTDAQSACVEIAFAFAADHRMPLNTIADFRAVLNLILAYRESVSARYGQVTSASVGVVMRSLLRLEKQGGADFFGAPCFDVADMLEPGLVTLLAADQLINSPRLYSAFLLFLLSDLYQRLPEVGDLPAPRLVFFFDESHLLFSDCAPALLRRIEQIARLIRSKGVGVYFVSQSPDDIPAIISDQLTHRIEHGRALPVGTAKVSTMDSRGKPLAPVTVKIAAPSFPLSPVAFTQSSCTPAAPVAPMGAMDWQGYLFLALAGLMIAALCIGIWAIWQSGTFPLVIAGAIGGLWGLKGRFA